MRKVLLLFCILASCLLWTGCSQKETIPVTENQFIEAKTNGFGDIVIETDDITEIATFVNYEVDGVTIQFIVVRASDGTVRIAFNTCQSCTPSPNAYFVQEGNYFVCQNCQTKFLIDEIGLKKGGCNPAPVEEKTESDGVITIPKDYADSMKDNFENWNGPTE